MPSTKRYISAFGNDVHKLRVHFSNKCHSQNPQEIHSQMNLGKISRRDAFCNDTPGLALEVVDFAHTAETFSIGNQQQGKQKWPLRRIMTRIISKNE